MHVLDKVRVIVYRWHEKGLEVFLENTDFDDSWRIPFEQIAKYDLDENNPYVISLGLMEDEDGTMVNTVAIQGDWHDIPSLRKLIKGDLDLVTSKAKYLVDRGAFFAVKETFKKVLPNEYKVLHDLKDILIARNMVFNI
ncbi:MAG: hypothetical protein R3301_10360 [Saprospiraceae bacterium]|nr:hypothetical protein [Saprospiraceae bacterium]